MFGLLICLKASHFYSPSNLEGVPFRAGACVLSVLRSSFSVLSSPFSVLRLLDRVFYPDVVDAHHPLFEVGTYAGYILQRQRTVVELVHTRLVIDDFDHVRLELQARLVCEFCRIRLFVVISSQSAL